MDIPALRNAIDTIVIVMMENRSFDHVLGHLSHEDYGQRRDVDGLHRPGPNFDWANVDDAGTLYPPEHYADGYLPTDLPHERAMVAKQLNAGAMDGFVKAYFASQRVDRARPPVPMRFCAPSDVPVTSALAEAYCVCDRWFAPLPSDTQPNRLMAISGQTFMDSTSDFKVISHWVANQPTVLDWLSRHNIPFEIYVDAPFIAGVGHPSNFVLMPSQWQHLDRAAHGLDTLVSRWSSGGPAPSVIYCEPYYNDLATAVGGGHGNCNHAPLPMAYGEIFLKKVYDALTSNPARWQRTLMILCYDEHGGFFDHVAPPPMRCAMPTGGTWHDRTDYTTLGIRVPAILVSPIVEPRSVFSGLLDHTSILQLIVDRFGAPSDLDFFGVASARRDDSANPIQSLARALPSDTLRSDIPRLPARTLALPAMQPGASANGRLFVDAMQAKLKTMNGEPPA
jgi:phospholipase C